MNFFKYYKGELFCEEASLKKIAEKFDTPCYVYSYRTLIKHYRRIKNSWQPINPIIAYSAKANSNLTILKVLQRLGSWVDTVSQGEIFRALKSGFAPAHIIFGGVGKTEEEIIYAIKKGIFLIVIDSAPEMILVNRLAKYLRQKAKVAFRINPDINPKTHPHIATGLRESKFGIDMKSAFDVYQEARNLSHLEVIGIHQHIGSQIIDLIPFLDAMNKTVTLVKKLNNAGLNIRYLDIGGGIGITYKDEEPFDLEDFSQEIKPIIKQIDCQLIIEPGRVIVGNAGVLLTRVINTKQVSGKKFVIIDAGMNDLIRPVLYNAYHEIRALKKKPNRVIADVVGPICESGDFLAKKRYVPQLNKGELIAVMSVGAYGFSMSSNYNSRTRSAEVMVSGRKSYLIRKRESMKDLIKGEVIPLTL